jgi:hypothetical protein
LLEDKGLYCFVFSHCQLFKNGMMQVSQNHHTRNSPLSSCLCKSQVPILMTVPISNPPTGCKFTYWTQ